MATIIGPATPVRTGADSLNQFGLLPSCTNGQQNAEPMPRIKYFADKVSANSTFVSICENNLSAGLTQIAETLKQLLETTCLTSPPIDVDEDPANGIQADCSVAERPIGASAGRGDTVVPACSGGASPPCWRLVEDRTRCGGSGYRVEVDRGGGPEPADRLLAVNCLTRR